jgi:hypothetical protein
MGTKCIRYKILIIKILIDKETWIGKYCSDLVLKTTCCTMEKYLELSYSPANFGPLSCYGNPGLAVFLVLLFLTIGVTMVVGVIIIVSLSVFIIIKRRTMKESIFTTSTGEFEQLE